MDIITSTRANENPCDDASDGTPTTFRSLLRTLTRSLARAAPGRLAHEDAVFSTIAEPLVKILERTPLGGAAGLMGGFALGAGEGHAIERMDVALREWGFVGFGEFVAARPRAGAADHGKDAAAAAATPSPDVDADPARLQQLLVDFLDHSRTITAAEASSGGGSGGGAHAPLGHGHSTRQSFTHRDAASRAKLASWTAPKVEEYAHARARLQGTQVVGVAVGDIDAATAAGSGGGSGDGDGSGEDARAQNTAALARVRGRFAPRGMCGVRVVAMLDEHLAAAAAAPGGEERDPSARLRTALGLIGDADMPHEHKKRSVGDGGAAEAEATANARIVSCMWNALLRRLKMERWERKRAQIIFCRSFKAAAREQRAADYRVAMAQVI